ncbi:hypothetical protein O6H91_Y536700 [Diphasiastrum complanatum]|nr:hypothetical protein O6H91_Y536700 [Diphasiastrum complanatum]KAJ7186321.1 hypothetical protein O6H91_Y536700 [Diphasiastrum complanatum]KAJ7186324.1 hypothetical protein O6H91_Y536700 [Diphasiastrum complanatum]KAJ7186325.1 hypothetical protein O6H91_Y536700 [Diphasiastrum complanatum]
MGCFSLSKSKRRARDRPLPPSQPAGLIYNNKPIALPDPVEVETGLYGRNLSAPSSFSDTRCTPPACASPLSSIESRAQSAPPSFSAVKNEANNNALPKRQQVGNGCTALCSRRVRPAPKRIQRSMSASWHSGPLVDSFKGIPVSSHSGPLFSFSSNCDSRNNGAALQNYKYAYRGRPLPLPLPQLSGHPLPLPLPQVLSLQSPQQRHVTSLSSLASSPACSTVSLGSFHDGFNPLQRAASKCLHPKPLPTPDVIQPRQLRSFTLQEIEARCLDFSLECCIGETCSGTMYRTWINDENSGVNTQQKIEVVIVRPRDQWSQDDEEFIADVTSLAEARSSHLCTLIGYSIERNVAAIGDRVDRKKRLLIYEHLPNGSLDRHLYRQEERSPLNWSTRMKIALDAARGLMQLHDKFPDKAMYWDFKPLYIQLDSTFSGKLTGYGFTKNFNSMDEIDESSIISAYVAPETAERGELSVKSNVWSFGVVLLELLTGRPSWDENFLAEQRDLVKWCTSFLKDAAKLFLVVDPELQGRYPAKEVRIVGNLALQCLQKDSHLRPHIGYVVEVLKSVQRMMSTPVEHKYEPAECVKDSVRKRRSLEEILHESDPEDDSSGSSSSNKAPGLVKMHEQLQENLKTSLSRLFQSSRSSLSCSSSFALERKRINSTIDSQVKLSQTG